MKHAVQRFDLESAHAIQFPDRGSQNRAGIDFQEAKDLIRGLDFCGFVRVIVQKVAKRRVHVLN